jgi:hypothetical protein
MYVSLCTFFNFAMTEYILVWFELKLELKCAWNYSHAIVVKYVSTNAQAHISDGKIASPM